MTAAPNPEGGPVMGCDDSGPTPVTLVDGGKVGEVKSILMGKPVQSGMPPLRTTGHEQQTTIIARQNNYPNGGIFLLLLFL